jgi:hypothetical protein
MNYKPELCKNCKEGIAFDVSVKGEWSHWHMGTYCRDKNGFTATPVQRAEPVLHTGVL